MPSVSSPDLAVALAERLSEVVPAGFVVHAQDSELVVFHNGEELGISGAPSILETVEGIKHPRENLETAIRAALSAVQDYVSESTAEPWPGTGSTQPGPDARVTEDSVLMWFGTEDDPALSLRPFDLNP